MKRKITCIVLVLALALSLCACRSDSGPDAEGSGGNSGSNSNDNDSRPVYNPPVVEELHGRLEGRLTLLAVEWDVNTLGVYVDLFIELHPGVQIDIDTYGWITDSTQQQAMMTRLIADPPDILSFNAEVLSFEKIAMDVLFVDLYDYMNGTRGINQENYYTNIFRAAEWRGGLYHIPLYADLRLGILNKRLLDAIGVDASQLTTVTISDMVDYCLRAADVFPNETLYPNRYFSTMQVLRMSRLYDIETGEVFVDTPEMRELFECAMTIPIDGDCIEFMPTGYQQLIRLDIEEWFHEFFRGSSHLSRDMTDGGLHYIFALWLQDHPDMQFSQLVTVVSGDTENIGFAADKCMSILRDSPNTELAWEFLRFIMELEEDLTVANRYVYVPPFVGLPINRARFENQTPVVLERVYRDFMFTMGKIPEITEDEQSRLVVIAMDYLRSYMEQLNSEVRHSNAVLHSLVYPELWLLHSEQQDVVRTLANIQSRLMLYVNE